jgi:hypothetical protein
MKPLRALAITAPIAIVSGCATIIGASFDDAGLAPVDANADGADDVILFGETPVVDVPVPPFDPSSIPGLVFWIDASHGVITSDAGTGAVTRWQDLSSVPHDAVPTNAAMTNVPTLVPNALNGLPVVRFQQSQLDLLVSSLTGPGGSNLTMFVVARGDLNSAIRFQTTAGAYPFVIFPIDLAPQDAGGPLTALYVGTSAQSYGEVIARFDGGATIATATWNANGTAATYDNGVLVEQRTDLPPALPSGQTLYLGGVLPLLAQPNTTIPFMNADYAEALVYSSALDDATRESIEGYLRIKWGI